MKISDLYIKENASAGATSSGSIASVAYPTGSSVIHRPNLFGYVPVTSKKQPKLRKKRKTNK